ncbi:MAG: ribonucleotide-diphosphate reductase subunit beta [Candidatus Rokuibacteriota bacterium]
MACGLPASGKTTTAMRLHARLGGVLIRSCDVYRQLGIVLSEWVERTQGFTANVAAYDRLRDEAYRRMARQAEASLVAGTPVAIIDAVHGERDKRQRLYETCRATRAAPIIVLCLCDDLETQAQRRQFQLNLICFAACIEGLFFFGAFAYVYFLCSRGVLHGLAVGTSWVFRDESATWTSPSRWSRLSAGRSRSLFDGDMAQAVRDMLDEAVACEAQFAEDLLGGGVAGLSVPVVRKYLEFCADQRLATLGLPKHYGAKNPLAFMDLQDAQEVTNFFERRVSAYQVGVTGEVVLDAAF